MFEFSSLSLSLSPWRHIINAFSGTAYYILHSRWSFDPRQIILFSYFLKDILTAYGRERLKITRKSGEEISTTTVTNGHESGKRWPQFEMRVLRASDSSAAQENEGFRKEECDHEAGSVRMVNGLKGTVQIDVLLPNEKKETFLKNSRSSHTSEFTTESEVSYPGCQRFFFARWG